MVQTRSTARIEREQNGGVRKRGVESQLQHNSGLCATVGVGKSASVDVPMVKNDVVMPANSVKSEPPPPAPASTKSGKSSLASAQTRKKRLEMQAAIQKAKIRMELIDKQLEVDIAELEEEIYSPHEEKGNDYVEKWLDSSYKEMDKVSVSKQRASSPAQDAAAATQLATAGPPQAAAAPLPMNMRPLAQAPLVPHNAPPVNTDATLHMLASTIKDLATTACSNNKSNANLLSRLSTPRELPEFSGDPIEWLQFKQSYDESTEVCGFSAKENLWRLRKCLRGAAKDTVSAMLISASSPDVIISTLQLRFGSPDGIINRIIQDIKRLPPVCHDYHKDIVMFSCKVRNFIEAVRALHTEEYLQGMSIVSIILSKLPTVLLSKWADYSYPIIIDDNKRSRLLILSDFLHCEAVKVSAITSSLNMSYNNYRPDNNKHHNNNYKTQTVLLQSEPSSSDDTCQFCNSSQQHKLTDCKQFKKALRKTRWQYVKRKGLCYKCLLNRHTRDTCPAAACDKDSCGAPHHRLLHFENKNSRERNDADASSEQKNSEQSIETVTHINASASQVLLKVVPVLVHGPNGTFSASALLDDGSTVSLISSELAERAGLRGQRESLRLSGAWDNNKLVCETIVTNVCLSGMDNKNYSIRVRSVKNLNLPLQRINNAILESKQLCKIKDKLLSLNNKPEILIGQDNYELLLPLEIISGNKNEPYATLTPLGWCIHGNVRVPQTWSTSGHVNLCVSAQGSAPTEDELMLRDLHEQVKSSFTVDSLGISSAVRENADDVRALAHLEKTSKLIDGRWYVSLPWKDPNCKLPNSYSYAYKRLLGIERKMSMCEGFAQRYRERIEHLLANDFAEELTNGDQVSSKVWYLPHFGVDNPNKKKLRLVFDAAGKINGLCLNDYLLSGPDLLSSLFGIMLRFREHNIAVTGDIKDMFLKIKIHPEDQHALRFLWRDSPTEPVKTYVMTSLIFGANCSPFVAQFIKNKNAERYESSLPSAVDAVRTSHYMDDYIHSFEDESSALEMVNNVIKIHKEGGFEIRNFTSNSLNVLQNLPSESVSESAVKFKIDQQYDGERTLGLIWFPGEDMLGFDVTLKRVPEDILTGKQRPTKRLMLSVIMSIFDVYGFLSPFIIQGRSMLQDTWRLNTAWDDRISDDIFNAWRSWLDLLNVIKNVRIPRCYLPATSARETENHTVSSHSCTLASTKRISAPTNSATTAPRYDAVAIPTTTKNRYSNLELHVFCDAATKAMCTVAYWRWDDDKIKRVAFVASKCRVMPVKPLTIPRAELQAALLAARLAKTIGIEHKLKPIRRYFWCDSTTVLHWIRNNTRSYRAFEANRLGEIDELSSPDEWRYVPSYLNVADLATREEFNIEIFKGEWLHGPAFLLNSSEHWPCDVIQPDENGEANSITLMVAEQSLPKSESPVPDPARFSSWLRLQRATAVVLKFVDACKGLSKEIDCSTLQEAERLLLRHAQLESFAEEIAAIKVGKSISRTSKLLTLTPVLDEHGLLRVGGRIDAALDVDLEVKKPVILDGRHPVARLIVRHHHVKAAHGNQETVVNDLKQKYWIIRLRPTVRTVVSQCMLCRIRKCKPHMPRMGDLPHARLAHHQRPFTFCGLDLFGPVEVAVGRRKEKRYCVLFTCLTVRAIHIEVVASLSTDSLIMALRRMSARRGWPAHLYSDNGTNLRGAEKELRLSMANIDTETLKREGANNKMDWHFIPPGSPHWGGAWERLIRTVKTSLKVVITERTPKEETFITLLAEVENMVNSRPLSHVSVDSSSVESLTPNHFLLGSSSNAPLIGEFDSSDMYLRKQWRKAQRLADMFWNRWVKEILPDMIPRKKWNEESEPLQVGDLVLVVDPSSPRNVWPRGIVHCVYPGKDGRIRMVDVKTKTGIWRRSVARVAPISLDV